MNTEDFEKILAQWEGKPTETQKKKKVRSSSDLSSSFADVFEQWEKSQAKPVPKPVEPVRKNQYRSTVDFADTFKSWEDSQKKSEGKKNRRPQITKIKTVDVPMKEKKVSFSHEIKPARPSFKAQEDSYSFKDVYAKWESSHDESDEISSIVRKEKSKDVKLTINQLRAMKVQDELDLHTYTLEPAIGRAREFLADSFAKGLRKVRIITGKGLHSPNGEAVIRPAIIGLVKDNRNIREADFHPKACDGGSGAIIIIFKDKGVS